MTEKKVPEGLVIPPKKPKLSKAERRALQEQQRAAKAAARNQDDAPAPPPQKPQQPPPPKAPPSSPKRKNEKEEGQHHNYSVVSHLAPYRDPSETFETGATLRLHQNVPLPQSVLELGYQYACNKVHGSNARCRSMLRCFDQVIQTFEPPEDAADLRQAVDQNLLKPSFQFWTTQCRPHSVSMGNAFTFLKTAVASLDRDITLNDFREAMHETILAYIQERIDIAGDAIANLTNEKLIQDDEVILTFGYSEVLTKVLECAKENGKEFRVILVDSRPAFGGRVMLERLRKLDIPCTYILLNAITYAMPEVTKVFLGASALMSDGAVWSRVGTASVALAAHMQQIPVLICSETYKISNRVQLESLTNNELGNPRSFQAENAEEMLPLLYDLTPAEFVSGIVTELGIVPPTSVAVLLREMSSAEARVSS